MKNNFFILYFFSLFILFFACTTKSESDYDHCFSGENKGKVDIIITNLQIDSVDFPEIASSSYEGDFFVRNNKLVFFDKYFGYGFQFDRDMNLEAKIYGQGPGPLEVNTGYVDGYLPLDGKDLFVGSSLDFHIHNKDGERQKFFRLPWGHMDNRRKFRRFPESSTGDEVELYELNYELLVIREDKNGFVYLPLVPFSDMISPYMDSFYDKARLLIKVDIDKEKIVEVFGRVSPEYAKYKAIPQHMFISYDINKKNNYMYISQEIDSLIYVYDEKGRNIFNFGNVGKGMNTNYLELTTFSAKQFQRAYFEDRPKRGYYANIEYFEEFDLLFRSYTKGRNSLYDGLQIYKGTTLIADVEVPKGMTWVKGYIAPYFYSNAIVNDEALTLKVYRFTLPESLFNSTTMD